MDTKEFKIWLITNDYQNAKQLADELGIHSNTISNYCSANRFPKIFVLALRALELNKQKGN